MGKRTKIGELRGKVIRGDGVGRAMKYPTANLTRNYFRYHSVPDGVYAGWVKIGEQGKKYKGAAVVGVDGKLEVHIIDWRGNLYGRYITVEIVKIIRPLRAYCISKELMKQVKLDIKKIKKILA